MTVVGRFINSSFKTSLNQPIYVDEKGVPKYGRCSGMTYYMALRCNLCILLFVDRPIEQATGYRTFYVKAKPCNFSKVTEWLYDVYEEQIFKLKPKKHKQKLKKRGKTPLKRTRKKIVRQSSRTENLDDYTDDESNSHEADYSDYELYDMMRSLW